MRLCNHFINELKLLGCGSWTHLNGQKLVCCNNVDSEFTALIIEAVHDQNAVVQIYLGHSWWTYFALQNMWCLSSLLIVSPKILFVFAFKNVCICTIDPLFWLPKFIVLNQYFIQENAKMSNVPSCKTWKVSISDSYIRYALCLNIIHSTYRAYMPSANFVQFFVHYV